MKHVYKLLAGLLLSAGSTMAATGRLFRLQPEPARLHPHDTGEAFDSRPDLVTGPAASTDAAIELVERLTGLEALDILDRDSLPKLKNMLTDALET